MVPIEQQRSDDVSLADDARPVLVRLLRVMFPHPKLPDGPYEQTADKVIEAANASTWSLVSLLQGLGTLDSVSGETFLDLDDADALKVLRHLEGTEFFGLIRRTAVVALYDDPEVWTALGYEGPSYDEGGYIHRGFDDLDWLPDPRIEEYTGPEQLLEVATNLPPAADASTTSAEPGGSSITEASHPGIATEQADQITTAEEL
jgi:hypothetical protein